MAQNFCPNCGAQLDGAKKFCTSCGQSVTQTAAPAQPAQAAQPQQPVYQPQPPAKKKSKAPVVIVIVVVLIAALAAAAYFTNGFGLFGGGDGDNNPSGNNDTTQNGGNNNGGNNNTSNPAKETKVGDVIKFGDYNWYVIDVDLLNKKALIITDKVIGKRAWHDTDMGNDAKVTWADCDLRAYLNGEFYKSLPEDFKSKIVEVVNQNPENERERPSESDPATNDKVFLLSVNEAIKYIGADVLTDEANGHNWWLRSPGMDGFYAAGVVGKEVYAGGYYASADDNGVRPALWITLGESTQQGGNNGGGNSNPTSTPGGNDNPTTSPGGNNGNATGYPAGWPNEVPKMDGNVIDGSIHNSDGNISGTAKLDGVSKNNVDDYISTLKSNGFTLDSEQELAASGLFMYQLSNGKCTVNVTFTTDKNQVIISLIKPK